MSDSENNKGVSRRTLLGTTAAAAGVGLAGGAAVMTVFGPLPPGRIDGDDRAIRFSRFSRTWIMCGQRWSSK